MKKMKKMVRKLKRKFAYLRYCVEFEQYVYNSHPDAYRQYENEMIDSYVT